MPLDKKINYDYVKDFITSKGYTLLSNAYSTQFVELDIMCPQGHIFKKPFYGFKKGKLCQICIGKSRIKKLAFSHERVLKFINEVGYQMLDEEYKNVKTKLNLICPNNHTYQVTFEKFSAGSRCTICNKPNSKGEKEIKKYLEKMHISFKPQFKFDDCKDKAKLPF